MKETQEISEGERGTTRKKEEEKQIRMKKSMVEKRRHDY